MTSIKDPDALAAAACTADLMNSQDALSLLRGWSGDTQAKTHSLLQIIEGKVKNDCNHFHKFLSVLGSLHLTEVVSRLQNSYGELCSMNLCQKIDSNEFLQVVG